MGSNRPSTNQEELLESTDTSTSRSKSTDSKTESTTSDTKSSETTEQASKQEEIMTFDPKEMEKVINTLMPEKAKREEKTVKSFESSADHFSSLSSSSKGHSKFTNNLDFRPGARKSSKSTDSTTSTTKSNFDSFAASMSPSFISLGNSFRDQVTPDIDIVEDTSLQIHDEKGHVLAEADSWRNSSGISKSTSTDQISSIKYPDGKVRNFDYSGEDLTGIEHLEPIEEGNFSQTTLSKENGKWYADVLGIKAQLPGEVQLCKSGVLSFQVDKNNWRSETPDGRVYREQANQFEARIARDDNNAVLKVTRADGSGFECKRENGEIVEITEINSAGDKIVWSKDGDKWVSSTIPPQTRLSFKVYENGNISYIDQDQVGKVVTTDGAVISVKTDGSKLEVDNKGEFKSIKYSNGFRLDDLKFNKQNQLTNVIMSGSEGKSLHYERQGNGTEWKLTVKDMDGKEIESQDWNGDIKVSKDGTVSYRDFDNQGLMKDNLWIVFRPNGQQNFVRTNDDGSFAIFDMNKNLLSLERADGSKLDVEQYRGSIVKFTVTEPGGDNVIYTLNEDTQEFKPDIGGYKTVKTLNANVDGSVEFTYADNTKKFFALTEDSDRDKLKIEDGDDKEDRIDPLDLIKPDREIDKPDDRVNKYGFSADVIESRERLTELMEGHLEGPQQKRWEIILDRYELRAKNRIEAQIAAGQSPETVKQEWDEKVKKSYDNLAKMLDPNVSGATYDINVRAKLVESMAFAMACPVKANDQGNWGCCWMISGVFCGIIQHPDKMTDMLQQLSNTGTFTDTNGKTWTPPKGLLSITSQGGRWTIENCGGGHRSPTSEILTSVAAYLSEDGRRTDRGSRGGTPSACNHAMKLITGDTFKVTSEQSMTTPKMKQELLEKGSYICIYPGHMYLAALEKHGEDWLVVASLQHGDGGRRINGTVSDLNSWNITGGRRRYNPDIDLPECQDSPTGPIGNNWPGGRTGGWGPDGPGIDPWPLLRPGSITFLLNLIDEGNRRRQREKAKEEEEEKRQKENERLEQERQLLEEKEAERQRMAAKEEAERKAKEQEMRNKKKDEAAKKRREALIKKQHMQRLKREEKFRKLSALNRAQALDSSQSFAKRSKQNNQLYANQGNGKGLSNQYMDQTNQGPININGFEIQQTQGSSSLTNHVELVSPVQEASDGLQASLEQEANSIDVNIDSPSTPIEVGDLKINTTPIKTSTASIIDIAASAPSIAPDVKGTVDTTATPKLD